MQYERGWRGMKYFGEAAKMMYRIITLMIVASVITIGEAPAGFGARLSLYSSPLPHRRPMLK